MEVIFKFFIVLGTFNAKQWISLTNEVLKNILLFAFAGLSTLYERFYSICPGHLVVY